MSRFQKKPYRPKCTFGIMNSALLSLLSLFPAVISVGERNRFIKTTHTASNIIGFPVSYYSDLISKGFNRKALTPHAEHHSLGFFLPCLLLFLSWRQLKLTHQASMDMWANGTYTKCKLFFFFKFSFEKENFSLVVE